VLFAFDLIEHDGDDLRDLPLVDRKWRLKKLIGKAKWRAIRFNEHLTGDGEAVFEHVCGMGLEGIVSKREQCGILGDEAIRRRGLPAFG